MIVKWDEAREGLTKVMETIEAPSTSGKQLLGVDTSGMTLNIEQRLLVVDGPKFSQATSYVMTLIPTANYSRSTWDVEHIGSKDGFNGIVLYHGVVMGQFVRIDRYENGISVDNLYVPTYKQNQVDTLVALVEHIMQGVRVYNVGTGTKAIIMDAVIIIGWRPYRPADPGEFDRGNPQANAFLNDPFLNEGGGGGTSGSDGLTLPSGEIRMVL